MLNRIDLSRTDLNLLTLFEVVLEERHVGRAAARLHVTPSAVSHGLGRLRRLLNDPLFIRHPKGLNPTDRALALAVPVAAILEQAREVVAIAEPFDPRHSNRRFVIAAVDAISAVLLPGLVAAVARAAPHVSLSVRSIFPFDTADVLDRRGADLALVPLLALPARFESRELYVDRFVIAARTGHPLLGAATLDAYCAADHLLVARDDDRGFVDDLLAERGLSRRIALTMPSFAGALAVLAQTDLVCAMPRELVRRQGAGAGLAYAEPPLELRSDRLGVVTAKAALADPGIVWLIDRLTESAAEWPAIPKARRRGSAGRASSGK